MCPYSQPPCALALQVSKLRGEMVGTECPCPKPPLCSVPGMCGGVGLNMDPHGRSRLPGVLVQRGLRQHGAGRRLGQEGQSWERRTVAFVG